RSTARRDPDWECAWWFRRCRGCSRPQPACHWHRDSARYRSSLRSYRTLDRACRAGYRTSGSPASARRCGRSFAMTPCAITPLRTDGATMARRRDHELCRPQARPNSLCQDWPYARIGLGVSNELLKSMEGRKSSTPPGRFWKPVPVEAGARPCRRPAQSGFRTNWNCRPSLRAGVSVMTFRLGTRAEIEEIFPVRGQNGNTDHNKRAAYFVRQNYAGRLFCPTAADQRPDDVTPERAVAALAASN